MTNETINETQSNAAKFAFFYLLSLVALIFTSLATGMIIFQLINKHVADVLHGNTSGQFSSETLKFAISALIIAAPIFFLTSRKIYQSLFSGALDRESGVRKWLTYFILLVSSVVMIGWLIYTINNFLDGELTLKFSLKALTAVGISVGIFTYYYHDIKRETVLNVKDKIAAVYLYGSLAVILVAFTASLFIVESPLETRNRKLDTAVLDSFNQIDQAMNEYYRENSRLPESLDVIKENYTYITDENIRDTATGEIFELKITGDRSYELCAVFRTDNTVNSDPAYGWYKEMWPHEAGLQCLKQRIMPLDEKFAPVRVPSPMAP